MEYPPQPPEQELQFIERKSPELLSLLQTAPLYKKHGTVQARPAVPGESITTVLSSGVIETSDNIAGDDDYVVTNPGGEEYIISKDKLEARYDATAISGVYSAKGYIKAIKNPYHKSIEILASWGQPQQGDSECYIADVCNEQGDDMNNEPYIIENEALKDTYILVNKEL